MDNSPRSSQDPPIGCTSKRLPFASGLEKNPPYDITPGALAVFSPDSSLQSPASPAWPVDCGPSVNSLPATALPCCARVIRCTESLFGSLGLVCCLPSVEKAKTPGQAADPPSILVHARRPRTALLSATPPCCTTPLRHIQPWGASHPPTPTPSQNPRTRLFRCRCRCERIFLFTLPLQQQAPCAVAPPRLSASSPVLLNPLAEPGPDHWLPLSRQCPA